MGSWKRILREMPSPWGFKEKQGLDQELCWGPFVCYLEQGSGFILTVSWEAVWSWIKRLWSGLSGRGYFRNASRVMLSPAVVVKKVTYNKKCLVCLILFVFVKMGFSVLPLLFWNSLCRQSWPQTPEICLPLQPKCWIKDVHLCYHHHLAIFSHL